MFVGRSRPGLESVDAPGSAAAGSRVANLVEQIIESVATGQLRSGDRVTEPFIEREFGASRYTVREALRVLVTQGVLEKIPFSGCRVTLFDEARLRQIYLARLQVELLALPDTMSAVLREPARLADLDDALAALDAAAEGGSEARYARADLDFHRTICRLSGNQIVCRLWDTLLPHVRIVRGVLGARVVDLAAHVTEHRCLRDAIVNGQIAVAEEIWRTHLLGRLHDDRPGTTFVASHRDSRPSVGRNVRTAQTQHVP